MTMSTPRRGDSPCRSRAVQNNDVRVLFERAGPHRRSSWACGRCDLDMVQLCDGDDGCRGPYQSLRLGDVAGDFLLTGFDLAAARQRFWRSMTTQAQVFLLLRRRHLGSRRRDAPRSRRVRRSVMRTFRRLRHSLLPFCRPAFLTDAPRLAGQHASSSFTWSLLLQREDHDVMPCFMDAERQKSRRGFTHGGRAATMIIWVSSSRSQPVGTPLSFALVLFDVFEGDENPCSSCHGHVVAGFASSETA